MDENQPNLFEGQFKESIESDDSVLKQESSPLEISKERYFKLAFEHYREAGFPYPQIHNYEKVAMFWKMRESIYRSEFFPSDRNIIPKLFTNHSCNS